MDEIQLSNFLQKIVDWFSNLSTIDGFQLKAELVQSKYLELYPKSKYHTIGYFIRAVNRISKMKQYITTTSKRGRSGRDHSIILQSDSIRAKCPIIISDITDIRIRFLADMKVHKSKPDIPITINPTKTPLQPLPFPLLQSLGIDINVESNKNQLLNLVSELVSLFKKSNEPLSFNYRGNDRPGLLIAVPKAKNYVTFDKNERTNKWLEEMMQFVKIDGEDSDEIWYWLLKQIYKKKPHVLIKMASDLGLVICNKMTDIEASAMWVEANISIRAARIILRHLQAKFGKRLQVPFSQISILSNLTDTIHPTFCEFEYYKDKKIEKVPEIMKYWTVDPLHLLELDFGRLLSSSKNDAVFGYESKVFEPTKLGVIAIIGADHGGGKSRYLLRVNYLPSSYRRKEAKVDAGTRTVQFAEVLCKKDVYPIQAKIAPVVNKAIRELESSMLVAIRVENTVMCSFLPSNATNMTCTVSSQNSIKLHYSMQLSQSQRDQGS